MPKILFTSSLCVVSLEQRGQSGGKDSSNTGKHEESQSGARTDVVAAAHSCTR